LSAGTVESLRLLAGRASLFDERLHYANSILVRAMVETKPGPDGGCITILRPDGSEARGSPVIGNGVIVPWAIAIDGNDHVWISNFSSATAGIVELAGSRP
jgi:hypothetical protein